MPPACLCATLAFVLLAQPQPKQQLLETQTAAPAAVEHCPACLIDITCACAHAHAPPLSSPRASPSPPPRWRCSRRWEELPRSSVLLPQSQGRAYPRKPASTQQAGGRPGAQLTAGPPDGWRRRRQPPTCFSCSKRLAAPASTAGSHRALVSARGAQCARQAHLLAAATSKSGCCGLEDAAGSGALQSR